MSLPVSAGDVIAVSILIKDVVKALDDSRGSATEYQEVIRELWSLDKALLEVEHLSRSCDATIELNALSCTARRAADQCRLYTNAFLDKIKSYNKSLGPGGSGSRLRDAAKRIQWMFAQKDELAKFQTELNGHASAINMLLITASLNFTKITGRNIHSKLTQVEKKHEISSSDTNSILSDIRTRLIVNNTQLEVQSKRIDFQEQAWGRFKNGMEYFSTLSSELKELTSSISSANRDNYSILLEIQTRIPREFKSCWIQEPVVFTDALGRIMPIHIELVNSWEVFDVVLAARFINLPGKRKIARKEIAFEDRNLAKDAERCQPFDSCFLPGRRIDMSMVFKRQNLCTSCPKCGSNADSSLGRAVQCIGTDCGLWFQIIEEVNNDLADNGTATSDTRYRETEATPSANDFSPFLYDEDVSSQQYKPDAGSSGTLNYDRFTSRTVTSFPNPYNSSNNFYHWLFGEQDTDDTGPTDLSSQGNDYLSTLLRTSDSTNPAPESTQNTFSAWR